MCKGVILNTVSVLNRPTLCLQASDDRSSVSKYSFTDRPESDSQCSGRETRIDHYSDKLTHRVARGPLTVAR